LFSGENLRTGLAAAPPAKREHDFELRMLDLECHQRGYRGLIRRFVKGEDRAFKVQKAIDDMSKLLGRLGPKPGSVARIMSDNSLFRLSGYEGLRTGREGLPSVETSKAKSSSLRIGSSYTQ
jgi:hypothetical protein